MRLEDGTLLWAGRHPELTHDVNTLQRQTNKLSKYGGHRFSLTVMGLYWYGTSTFESINMISVSSGFTLSGLIQQSQHYVRTGNVYIIMWNLFPLVSVPANLSASCQNLGVFYLKKKYIYHYYAHGWRMESQLANTQWSDTNNLCPGEFNTTCLQVWITRNVSSSCCESPNSELPLAKHVM